jgi:hypothetical protein
MAAVMRHLGYKCGHERVYKPNIVADEGDWEADSSAMAPAFFHKGWMKPEKVFHVHRNPLKFIRSQLTDTILFTNPYGELLHKWCPSAAKFQDLGKPPTLEWAARFWIDWNRIIDEHADYAFSISEVGPHVIKDITEILGDRHSDGMIWEALEAGQECRNQHVRSGAPEMTWEDLEDLPFINELMVETKKRGYSL